MSSYRKDFDSLGEVQVPASAYYGPFTVRASLQYNATGQRSHINVIKAFAMIKRSAALANKDLGVLEAQKADAIVKASDEILFGMTREEYDALLTDLNEEPR